MDITIILIVLLAAVAGVAIGHFMGKSKLSRLEERNRSLEKHLNTLQDMNQNMAEKENADNINEENGR